MKRICLGMMALAGSLCMAQTNDASKEPPKFYKLDFVVKDVEGGKVITARNYSMIVESPMAVGSPSQIRAGSKAPIGPNSNMVDIGTSIDCSRVMELDSSLSFSLSVEVSSVLGEPDAHPVIRQNRWSSFVIVPFKKPTVVFSSDDNTTKRVLQLEVTATPRI
jgi:hypothetical protein